MPKYLIEESTLRGLANAIRTVAGTDRTYTPTEMIEAITTILENGAYILVDENSIEAPAVFVSNDEKFTATANDIRIGKTAVTEAGVTEGTKEIPAYHTTEGNRIITAGSDFKITFLNDNFDFTKLQVIVCPYATTIDDSVVSEKVAIGENVYAVNSDVVLATVTRNVDTQSIDLNIVNDTDKPYVLRYITYKEVF